VYSVWVYGVWCMTVAAAQLSIANLLPIYCQSIADLLPIYCHSIADLLHLCIVRLRSRSRTASAAPGVFELVQRVSMASCTWGEGGEW
jgi:hypothetical protein